MNEILLPRVEALNLEHNPKCRDCGIALIINENWYESCYSKSDYMCKDCKKNHSIQWHNAHKEHSNARKREYNYIHGGKPMSENKTCPAYLGCHVAEKMLSKVFKDVEVMPTHNPGFDFICNRGKKIDVKSSCEIVRDGKSHAWQLCINNNTVADYFLCIAFDNREDLNPLYLWLVDGSDVRHLKYAYISETTLPKWNKYSLDISNIVKYCKTKE